MERCENCNRMLFIDSRNEQKRFDTFKKRVGYGFCSSCRKRYEKEEISHAISKAMGDVMGTGHYPFYGG